MHRDQTGRPLPPRKTHTRILDKTADRHTLDPLPQPRIQLRRPLGQHLRRRQQACGLLHRLGPPMPRPQVPVKRHHQWNIQRLGQNRPQFHIPRPKRMNHSRPKPLEPFQQDAAVQIPENARLQRRIRNHLDGGTIHRRGVYPRRTHQRRGVRGIGQPHQYPPQIPRIAAGHPLIDQHHRPHLNIMLALAIEHPKPYASDRIDLTIASSFSSSPSRI